MSQSLPALFQSHTRDQKEQWISILLTSKAGQAIDSMQGVAAALNFPLFITAFLTLLFIVQNRDPRAFQLLLQTPEGATFLGSTPELLYRRSGDRVASEAVAATRPRGPPGDCPH